MRISFLALCLFVISIYCCKEYDYNEKSGSFTYKGKAKDACWSIWPKTKSGYSVDVITFTLTHMNFGGQQLEIYKGGVSVDSGTPPDIIIDDTMLATGESLTRKLINSSGRAWIQASDSDIEIQFTLSYTSSGENLSPSLRMFYGLFFYFITPFIISLIGYYALRPTGEDVLYEECKFVFRRRLRFIFGLFLIIVVIIFVFCFLSLSQNR